MIPQELSRAEAATSSGQHQVEQYVMDSRGALVKRNGVVLRERLTVGHCLAISVLVVRPSMILLLFLLYMILPT